MPASKEIIQRLEAICAEYITMGGKMELAVGPLDLIRVTDRVIATVEGEHPDSWPIDSPHEAFLEGLVEELLDHPNTVSEIVLHEDGSKSFEPLSTTTWLDTLYEFKEQLEKSIH